MRILLIISCGLFVVAGCGDDDVGGGGDTGVRDGAAIDSTTGLPPVVPAPQMDPTTMKWMCSDVSGQMHVCQCNDGIDNDNDQSTDSADVACANGPYTDSEALTGGCGTTQCTNCMDDDRDGKTDGADPECTGGLDNSEASYATGIPGDNSDACKQDCFFDGNSGAGDDHCEWNLKCDPANPGGHLERSCPYDSSFRNCPATQTAMCKDFCQKYTPNGCDCFGCCTVFNGAVSADVLLAPTCSGANLADTNACPRCTKVTTCGNTCDPCEYCLGRPPLMTCTPLDGGVGDSGIVNMQCPAGITACTPIDNACSAGYFCLTGCCIPNIN